MKFDPEKNWHILLPKSPILILFVDNPAFLFLNQNELDLIEQEAKLN